MKAWIAGEIEEIPSGLEALDAVRHHPVRKKCLMLSWEALADGLQEHMQNAEQSPHAK
jgi:nitrogen fixation NifU-like protein